jgi:gamma-glutamylcyclotransferase (GGCT)/AIG2-like uncharacterized protein YtfP
MQKVSGQRFTGEPAILHDYARYCIDREVYPGLVAEAGAMTQGILYTGIDAASMARLDAFEGETYRRIEVSVRVNQQTVMATVYCTAPEYTGRLRREPWQADVFQQLHMQAFMELEYV